MRVHQHFVAFALSALGGGEGWGEVGEPPALTAGATYLTLPIADAMGPLPLPHERAERAAYVATQPFC